MSITPSALRADLYRYLDRVLETGEPLEILRNGHVLRIVVADPPSIAPERAGGKLSRLVRRDVGVADPFALADEGWADAWSDAP